MLANEDELNILFYSSLIFITNIAATFYKEYYIYTLLFILLTISSLLFHYPCNNIYVSIIDKICIVMVVLYGGFMLYNKTTDDNYLEENVDEAQRIEVFRLNSVDGSRRSLPVIIVVISFLLVNYLYFYGYCTNQYCFHPNKYMGDISHALIHISSSFGHHFITFL